MRTLIKSLVVTATLAVTALPAAPSPVDAAPPALPAPTNYLRLLGETNGGGSTEQVYTRTEAVALARRFDMVAGLRWTFDEHIAAMKAANPRLRMIVYMNGAMSKPKDAATMPESWFMHDANGNRVRNLHFDLFYMDVGNAGWRNWVAQRCADWIRLSRGGDGCFLDDLGAGNLGTNLSAWPIDPRTGARMVARTWLSYARNLQGVVQQANPNHLITSNGLNNGDTYFLGGSWMLLDTAHASMAEGWLRGSRAPITKFRDVTRWKQDVDMLVDAGNRGRSVLVGTKLWVAGVSAASQNQWRLYTYASFLLGTNGYQYLNFNIRGPGKPDAPHPYESFNIGSPQEAYALRGGVYQRRFSAGLAVVNPGLSSVTVDFGRSYRMPTGEFRSSYTMAPNTGLVLRTT